MTNYLPTLDQLKVQARALQKNSAPKQVIAYAKSLEMIAHRYGFKNWNVIAARAPQNFNIKSIAIGSIVEGQYLGQTFVGTIKTISSYGSHGYFKVSIAFIEPIDVVKFNSFSSLRHRVNCVIDGRAISPQRTSDGTPHLILSRIKSTCAMNDDWQACCV